MGTTSTFTLLLLSAFCLYSVLPAASEREALEITTAGGHRDRGRSRGRGHGYGPAPRPKCAPPPPKRMCPPPPPPPPPPMCPPPPPPPRPRCPPRPLTRLEKARKVLLKFTRVISDPKGYTKNWKEGTDTCTFNGVRCATYPKSSEKAVAGVDLNQAGISGLRGNDLPLTGILGGIPELTFFHVNSNNFSGALPNIALMNFNYFYELDLSNNMLSGEFPKQILDATLLVFLDLRFNRLSGPIPAKLFNLDLDVIFINNNNFNGPLPDNFGSTPARYLTFANNQITGPIPRSIGKASKTLTEVLFLGNKLDGCLPYEIGLLKKATVFDASRNSLTGHIPHSFACLERIQFLNLAQNQLYGAVPELVCLLPGLRNNGNFSLADNYFTHVGPACLLLIEANVLDVSNNCILGLGNQRPPEQCVEFFLRVNPFYCPNIHNHESLLNYIPCPGLYSHLQSHWHGVFTETSSSSSSSPQPPVTYDALRSHHHRL